MRLAAVVACAALALALVAAAAAVATHVRAAPAAYAGCAASHGLSIAPGPPTECALCSMTCAGSFTNVMQTNIKSINAAPPTCLRIVGPVVGNLKLSDSPTCVKFAAAGDFLLGDIAFGDGADCLSMVDGTALRGRVTLGDGADSVTSSGADVTGTLSAGDGDDYVAFASGGLGHQCSLHAIVDGGDGADTLQVLGVTQVTSVDVLKGGDGNDVLQLDQGVLAGHVDGGAGDDTIGIGPASTVRTVNGGRGNDLLLTYPTGSVSATMSTAGGHVIDKLAGGDGDDCVVINAAAAPGSPKLVGQVVGGDGNDVLVAWNRYVIDGDIALGSGTDDVELRAGIVNGNVRASGGKPTTLTLDDSDGEIVVNGDVALGSSSSNTLSVTGGTNLIRVNGNVAAAPRGKTATCTLSVALTNAGQTHMLVGGSFTGCTPTIADYGS